MVADYRPVAEGFKKTPLIEAVIDVTFVDELSPELTSELREIIGVNYPAYSEEALRAFQIDLETDTASIQPTNAIYRFLGDDPLEIALLRPNGFAASQLAPYKCWEELFSRFTRDSTLVFAATEIKAARIATRFINRIDVPTTDGIAQYEEYLGVHIHVPKEIENIGPFQLAFQLDGPEHKAKVVIQSSVTEPAIEGVASFTLDIDVAQSQDLPESWADCLANLAGFRDLKNYFYRTLLTPKALEEFELLLSRLHGKATQLLGRMFALHRFVLPTIGSLYFRRTMSAFSSLMPMN